MQAELGISLLLQPMDHKMLLARLSTDPSEMYFLMKGGLYNDPLNHLNGFVNTPEPNFSRYRNTDYEKLVERIKRTPIGAERTALAREANQVIVEKDVVVIPLLVKRQNFGVRKTITGFHVNPYQVIQLRDVRASVSL